MITITPNGEAETLADLIHHLGDIPPSRILLRPAPGTATIKDVVALEAPTGLLYELIDGVLVLKGMEFIGSVINGAICAALFNWVATKNLGLVTGAGGMIQLSPNQVRIPDAAYISWARVPGGRVPKDPAPLLSPDLIVEVLGESNTKPEMNRKRREYFAAGMRLVWEVDLVARNVAVYSGLDSVTLLDEQASLDGGDVLPGFEFPLPPLFAELDEINRRMTP